MRKGFVYKYDLCVACNACVAACYLSNDTGVAWRSVLTDNPQGCPGLPVHNLSVACNHCDEPVCLYSCPASVYRKDADLNAIIADSGKCIGCNYCYWNCPYDAPRYNKERGEIEKCHLCYERLRENIMPACASACPTGALSYDKITTKDTEDAFKIPANDLGPALKIIDPRRQENVPEIYPQQSANEYNVTKTNIRGKINPVREWPLIFFTYMTSLLFAFSFSAWQGSDFVSPVLYVLLIVLSAAASFFHLGKPLRFYRSLMNLNTSPLSREILAFTLFAVFSSLSLFYDAEILWVLSFMSGLLMLIAVDSVYTYSDKRSLIRYHSAQVFLTALLFSSFLISAPLPFIFIAMLKVSFLVIYKLLRPAGFFDKYFSFLYIIFMIFISYFLFHSPGDTFFAMMFGILMLFQLHMIIMFYFDFSPLSLRFEFSKNKTNSNYEKKTG